MPEQASKEAGSQAGSGELIRLAIEIGPLAVFFLSYARLGIFWGTGVFMAATAVSLAAAWIVFRKLPVMPMVSGLVVLVFGGLTLALGDENFIKMKPTVVSLLFAAVLLGGLLRGKLVWKALFKDVMQLTDEGWRILQFRWGIFFLLLAMVNEVVRHLLSTGAWVNFKVFLIVPASILFAALQVSLINRYRKRDDVEGQAREI